MGGHGSGGARPGSGRKPEDVELPEAQTVARPKGLPKEVSAVWDELEPRALQRGTLTEDMVPRFVLLCEALAEYRLLARAIRRDPAKRAELSRNRDVMMQQANAGLKEFRLTPNGRPVVTVKEKPTSALEKLQARRLRAV